MLFKHSVLYLFARGLPGIINFLAIAVYTRLLSPEEYGRYSLVVAGVGFFNVVFFQWLRLSLLRFLPTYLKNTRILFSTVLVSFATLMLITGTTGVLLAALWPDPVWQKLLLFSIPLLWTQAWFELNLELQRSRLQPVRYGLMSGMKAVLSLGLGVLIVLWGFGAYGPLTGLLVGMLFAGQWGGWKDWKQGFSGFSSPLFRELLRYGLPLTATFALAFVVSASDRFLIAYFLGEDLAGVYAAGYDLGQQSLTILMMMVNLAAYPLAVRALELHGVKAAQNQLKQNAILLLAVAVPATMGLIIVAPNVTSVFLGADFREAATLLLPWVSLAILFSGVRAYHFDLAFQLGRYTMGQIWVVGTAAIINIILNVLLIPLLGLKGAVYATVIAYFLALFLSIMLGRRVFPVPFSLKDAFKIVVASLIMAMCLLPTWKFHGFLWLMIQILTGITVYGILFVLFNVGDYRTKVLRRIVKIMDRKGSVK